MNKLYCSLSLITVLKNDSGFFVNALKGFLGVYTHYADDTIGEDGLLVFL